ncbi:Pectin lyase E [Mycena venus]|uniref:pectin lyase n=1 Tax=Mycena venus TaxID=2733690 RepID=A0A8H6U420_9AGAR|nr:Pectin lyase E [Mycena venus]
MKSFQLVTTVLAVAGLATAQLSSLVTGTAPGFAAGVTGGGSVPVKVVTNINDLKAALTATGPMACNAYCAPPSAGGQSLLNTLGGCGSLPLSTVTLDTAGITGINVQSDKTLVGVNHATLIGKGLRFVGVSNIIIQNIAITNLNPAYLWGGDAFSFSDTSKIWIDHVTVAKYLVSNSTGASSSSAQATESLSIFKNFVSMTSGRSPALSGNTLFHAVKNVWENNSGHLIEGTSDGMGVYEGNAFINTPTVVVSDFVGQLYSSPTNALTQCATALHRNCVANSFSNAGAFNFDQTGFFSDFSTLTIAPAASAASIVNTVPASAGNTL